MHRIDNSTAIAVLPTPAAPGVPGYFTGGNPISGTPATIVDQEWLNAQQESPIALMAAAGILPVKGDYTGEKRAVLRVAGGNVTGALTSMSLTPDHAGLVVVSASAPLTLTLPLSNAAGGVPIRYEIVRADTTAHAVNVVAGAGNYIEAGTSIALLKGVRLTLISDGASAWYLVSTAVPIQGARWERLPSGMLIQRGRSSSSGGGFVAATLPTQFASDDYAVGLGGTLGGSWSASSWSVGVVDSNQLPQSFGIRWVNYNSGTFTQANPYATDWIAIGRG